jgi:hypothetical protein
MQALRSEADGQRPQCKLPSAGATLSEGEKGGQVLRGRAFGGLRLPRGDVCSLAEKMASRVEPEGAQLSRFPASPTVDLSVRINSGAKNIEDPPKNTGAHLNTERLEKKRDRRETRQTFGPREADRPDSSGGGELENFAKEEAGGALEEER